MLSTNLLIVKSHAENIEEYRLVKLDAKYQLGIFRVQNHSKGIGLGQLLTIMTLETFSKFLNSSTYLSAGQNNES